jgi:glycosyltransferase involved in cell wall biosynthesis
MPKTVLVIPCFDEASRLRPEAFSEYLQQDPETDFLFVDDGSRDATPSLLEDLAEAGGGRITVIHQPTNRGKAEAVRVGMRAAFESGALYAGYFDADLATPLREVPRLRSVLEEKDHIEMVFGSRVQLLGRSIERRPLRHYFGRVFATVASQVLDLAVYDTQCGAKLFRSGPEVRRLFDEPFLTTWVFDVELIARWRASEQSRGLPAADRILYELPVNTWVDVPGSKVRPSDFVRALLEIWRIHRRYLAGRARRTGRE